MEGISLLSEETLRQIVCTMYLAICAMQDLRRRKISIRLCAFAGMIALALNAGEILTGSLKVLPFLGGLLPGALLLLLAFVSGGAAGIGDGICFLILGAMLETRVTWILLMCALVLVSACGGILMLVQKAGRKTRMPFLTFTAAAWAGILAARLSGLNW